MVVEGKRRDKSAERCGVHDEEQRAENRPLGNATKGSMEGSRNRNVGRIAGNESVTNKMYSLLTRMKE